MSLEDVSMESDDDTDPRRDLTLRCLDLVAVSLLKEVNRPGWKEAMNDFRSMMLHPAFQRIEASQWKRHPLLWSLCVRRQIDRSSSEPSSVSLYQEDLTGDTPVFNAVFDLAPQVSSIDSLFSALRFLLGLVSESPFTIIEPVLEKCFPDNTAEGRASRTLIF